MEEDYKSRKQNTPTEERKRFPAENDPSTSNDYTHNCVNTGFILENGSFNLSNCGPLVINTFFFFKWNPSRYYSLLLSVRSCPCVHLLRMFFTCNAYWDLVLERVVMLIKEMFCWVALIPFYRFYMVAAVLWPLQFLTQNQFNNTDCLRDQNKIYHNNWVNFHSPLDLMVRTDQTRQSAGFGGADVSNAIGSKLNPSTNKWVSYCMGDCADDILFTLRLDETKAT